MARSGVVTTANRIRRHLGPGHNQEIALLRGQIDDVNPIITFTTPTLPRSVQPGVTLGLEFELVRVVSVDEANVAATVLRGFLDSDPIGHADGCQIDIAPRFSMLDIVDAMHSEIASWGSQLYSVHSRTFQVATTSEMLELPAPWASALGVVACYQSELSTFSSGERVWPQLPIRLIRGELDFFDGAPVSGILIRFLEPIRTGQVHVVVALPFDISNMTPASDLTTDHAIPDSMFDILEIGTQLRLIMNSDNARSSRHPQDEARRAEESPLGTMVSVEQLQIARYERRKAQEVRLLRRRYPVRIE
jgi:hypothetical protein